MQKHIKKRGEEVKMSGKITTFLREYVFPFSIILTIIGGILLLNMK